jgi:cyclopropane fatty-acyl-phospholipid synthase-like methyltransferase
MSLSKIWHRAKYKPVLPLEQSIKPSSKIKPWDLEARLHASYACMAMFSDAMQDSFREGMKILDFGCGVGRYAIFMSYHLKEFRYLGTDISIQLERWRGECDQMSRDQRVRFAKIFTEEEEKAIRSASVILALSVYTHLDHGEFEKAIARFKPSIVNGCVFVFSLFMNERSYLAKEKAEGYYHQVYYSEDHIERIRESNPWMKMTKFGIWYDRVDHTIYRIERS